MFQQFLQLDLTSPHDKQLYSLKKDELVLKSTSQSIKFDSICYSSDDIMSKLTYKILTATISPQPQTISVTFNYNISAKDLILLIKKLLGVKSYNAFKLAHFQIKNGHISDYHKNASGHCPLIDDMDQFDKDIDVSLKIDRLSKVSHLVEYREITKENFDQEVGRDNKKFGKRTNQFFILDINDKIKIVIILLPRNRDLVLTSVEEKEIEELFILQKNSNKFQKENISFISPITNIIKNSLQEAKVNFFVSCFPQEGKSLEETLKLPLRMGHPREEEVKNILEGYHRDITADFQRELQKAKKRLKQSELYVKNEEQNIKILSKTYSRLFGKTQPKIRFLKDRGVTNMYRHIDWLRAQLKQKQQEVREQEQQLKQMHHEIILQDKRKTFYMNKIISHKQSVQSKQNTAHVTPAESVFSSTHDDNLKATEQLLLYYYDPKKEMDKYRQKKEQIMKNKLDESKEKKQFLKMYQQAKKHLSFEELTLFQQDYYSLLHA